MEDRSKDQFRMQRALEACLIANNPSHKLKVIGITGTNGKTTSTFLMESILKEVDLKPALLGTVVCRYGEFSEESSLTTPGPMEFQSWLSKFTQMGAQSVVTEVSSHGLDQFRIWGTKLSAAIFTNLTQDHLDYHNTMEKYYEAKKRLFFDYDCGVRIVNIDDVYGKKLFKECKKSGLNVFSFGTTEDADYCYKNLNYSFSGITGEIKTPQGSIKILSPLLGNFNGANITGCVATALELGISANLVTQGIARCKGVPGRLESVVSTNHEFQVLVDYAHTPDALKNILETLRPLCKNKLRVLFGCGGDRDATKRPKMAAIAESLADVVVVTSDNPRTEDPEKIISDIYKGFQSPVNHFKESDRMKAIKLCIAACEPEDILVIAGKGHENYQILGTTKHPFDDRLIAKKELDRKT